MPDLLIRTAVYPQDFPAILELWSQAGPGIHVGRSDQPQEIEKKLQRDPELFLLAELDGQPVGSVLGGFDGRRGMMYHLAVSPAHRRRGIGEALMAELEARLKAKGCLRYYLLVTHDNHESIDFYLKRGWENLPLYAFGKDLV